MIRVAMALALAFVADAHGQTSFQRTQDNKPDLQGIWESRWSTPLERAPGLPLSVDVERAKEVLAGIHTVRARRPGNANPDSDFDFTGLTPMEGLYRTSLVIEPQTGKIPFSEAGARQRDKIIAGLVLADNPEDRPANERCTAGAGRAPLLSTPSNSFVQIVQTRNHLLVWAEGINDVRIVPIEKSAPPIILAGLQGVSAAKWEGDVFVVQTTGFRTDDILRFAPPNGVIVISPTTIITERFTPVSADTFHYRFTVSDPALYSQTWSAETAYQRSNLRMFEYACHEGNYAMSNILLGGREMERRAKAKQ